MAENVLAARASARPLQRQEIGRNNVGFAPDGAAATALSRPRERPPTFATRDHLGYMPRMATKLEKPLKREVLVGDKLYTLTISPAGLKLVEKGHRLGHELTWPTILSGTSELTDSLSRLVETPADASAGTNQNGHG